MLELDELGISKIHGLYYGPELKCQQNIENCSRFNDVMIWIIFYLQNEKRKPSKRIDYSKKM